jgi:hypothetical protein
MTAHFLTIAEAAGGGGFDGATVSVAAIAAIGVALAAAIHGLALVIVNLTPTPKDNAALSNAARVAVRAYRVLEILAGVVSPRVKR